MSTAPAKRSRRFDPDLIAGTVVTLGAGALLLRTSAMPPMTALLPVTMLLVLMVLGALLIIRCLVRLKRDNGVHEPLQVFTNIRRFLGIAAAIVVYVACVANLGFYTSTAVMIPIVAWCFGYRNVRGLLLADVIFTGSIAIIFVLLMGQELPTEFFLR
uniref:tripartite tricarboxylate transporter TctB family protein n=1 Tax=Halomonas sp. TaxID=1486246 RepID=UPI00263A2794|nr:tripartite tricarboxylate transporter TctB family protein [Halomonas sp.]